MGANDIICRCLVFTKYNAVRYLLKLDISYSLQLYAQYLNEPLIWVPTVVSSCSPTHRLGGGSSGAAWCWRAKGVDETTTLNEGAKKEEGCGPDGLRRSLLT